MRRTILLLATMGTLLVIASGTALSQTTVTLSPQNATNLPVYSEHRITAQVRVNGDLAPATVTFTIVSGPDQGLRFVTEAPGGVVEFRFPNSGLAGTDTIRADARGSQWWGSYSGSGSTTATFTDTVPPTVDESSLAPAKGAAGVVRDISVTAGFSEKLEASTLSASTFKLYQWNKKKKKWKRISDVEVGYVNEMARLDPYPSDPSRLLAVRKKYKAVITTGAQDLNGHALADPYAWTFKTRRR